MLLQVTKASTAMVAEAMVILRATVGITVAAAVEATPVGPPYNHVVVLVEAEVARSRHRMPRVSRWLEGPTKATDLCTLFVI